MEYVLCAKYCAKCWGHSSNKDVVPRIYPIAMETDFFFLINLFIYLFIGCIGSSLLYTGFL